MLGMCELEVVGGSPLPLTPLGVEVGTCSELSFTADVRFRLLCGEDADRLELAVTGMELLSTPPPAVEVCGGSWWAASEAGWCGDMCG